MARKVSLVFAGSFLIVGVWGLISGGHNHHLLVFGVNAGHNLVHFFSGILALLAFAFGEKSSRAFLWFVVGGYGVVALAGIFALEGIVQALNINTADNILHISLVGLALFGLYKSYHPVLVEK